MNESAVNKEPELSLATINGSGYPLQIAVAHALNTWVDRHGWQVCSTEHYWSLSSASHEGFADIVVGNRSSRTFAVIECKRVQDTEWLLFSEDGRACSRTHAQVWIFQPQHGFCGWDAAQIEPACPEVHFCVLRGQSKGERLPLLERTAAEVARATEGVGREYARIRGTGAASFFPVVVTTAALKLARFDPSAASLTNGKLSNARFEVVPYVRLRKQLGVFEDGNCTNGEVFGYRKESTVFVVQAQAVNDFFARVELGSGLTMGR